MRALCGAIIMAGAMIGLGLAAIGFGLRFQALPDKHPSGTWFEGAYVGVPSLAMILVILIAAVLIGVVVAFLGLAYHHERRHRELLREMGAASPPHMPVS